MRRVTTILAVSSVAVLAAATLAGAGVDADRPTAVNGAIAYPCMVNFAEPTGTERRPALCLVIFKPFAEIEVVTLGQPPEMQPAWSPEGTRLAYVADGRINIRGIFTGRCGEAGCFPWIGKVRQLTAAGSESEPAWSRDGTRIAFVSRRGGNADVYLVRAGGGTPRQLTRSSQDDVHPTWAPSGREIAFARNRNLYVVGAQGGSERHVGAGLSPSWSPDGKRLAFEWDGDIWIARADGSARANVTRTPGVRETDPAWSPDGKKLAFPGLPEGESAYDLYVVALGRAPRRVRLGGDQERPFASPSLDWQPLPQIVKTVYAKRPIVSLRDIAGRRLTKIRAGYYTFGEVDRSPRHSIHISWEQCCPRKAKWVGRRFSPADAVGVMLRPGVYRYWCPFHPKAERGTIKVVDDP
jgi:hypothetical protein